MASYEEDLCSGYLYKSPPASMFKSQVKGLLPNHITPQACMGSPTWTQKVVLMGSMLASQHSHVGLTGVNCVLGGFQKSWKRRFFILKNIKTSCHLEYFKSDTKTKSELLGSIDLSQVSLMLLRPETHTMWEWVHENFRCSAASVLFMKVADRDYFFIGENSWEVERWFRALFNALNGRPHRLLNPEDSGRIRDISAPPDSEKTGQKAEWRSDAHNAKNIRQKQCTTV